MNDWDDIRYFLACMRSRSLTEAARVLGVNQSTVSRRIAAVEAAVGGVLFHRSARSFTASDLAVRLLPHAEDVERAAASFAQRAHEEELPRGIVRIATSKELSTFLLAPALGRLHTAYPGICIEFASSSQLVDLSRHTTDVALRTQRPTRGQLVARRIGNLRYAVYAAKDYLHRVGCGHAPDLTALDWLTLDDSLAHLAESQWVERQLGSRRPTVRADSTIDLAIAAGQGLGAALLPEALTVLQPNLVRVDPEAAPVLERGLWLVTHRELADVPRVRAVMAWIHSETAAKLAA